MTDRNRSWAAERASACLGHVVGDDGKNCRNCGISAAWLAEGNRRRNSTYEVPGSSVRHIAWSLFPALTKYVYLWGSKPAPDSDEWIEVVWP